MRPKVYDVSFALFLPMIKFQFVKIPIISKCYRDCLVYMFMRVPQNVL